MLFRKNLAAPELADFYTQIIPNKVAPSCSLTWAPAFALATHTHSSWVGKWVELSMSTHELLMSSAHLWNYPAGITKLDFQNSRLYWTCAGSHKVISSGMDGQDIQMVIHCATHWGAHGIGVSGDRVYWTNFQTNMLESGTKSGEDVNILHGGTGRLYGLTVAPSRGKRVGNRTNHCENRACS